MHSQLYLQSWLGGYYNGLVKVVCNSRFIQDFNFLQSLIIITDQRKINVEADPDTPQISLEEMLDELNISADVTGAEGGPMME